jgi:hypothetical protein
MMDRIDAATAWLTTQLTNLAWFIRSWLPQPRHRHHQRPVHSYRVTTGNPTTIAGAFTGARPLEFTVVVFQCTYMCGPDCMTYKVFPGVMELGDFTPLATVPPLPSEVPA